MNNGFSLTPGFSPVLADEKEMNRFNGFFTIGKPLKRLAYRGRPHTRLKPGVNEMVNLLPIS